MAGYYAVVTGASSGIGAELAKCLARQGYNLILVARRKERLEKLETRVSRKYGTDVRIIEENLSSREGCLRLYDQIKDEDIGIFINNAGFGDCGDFTESNLDKGIDMIDVNVKAVHILTRLMTEYFKERDRGYLLNVASSAGLFPGGPFMATYYATKAYVVSLTRGVAEELRQLKSNVYIGALCPGPVDTEFNSVANVEFALKGISPKYCANYAVHMMFKRREIIIPTTRMKLAVWGAKHASSRLVLRLTSRQQRKKLGE